MAEQVLKLSGTQRVIQNAKKYADLVIDKNFWQGTSDEYTIALADGKIKDGMYVSIAGDGFYRYLNGSLVEIANDGGGSGGSNIWVGSSAQLVSALENGEIEANTLVIVNYNDESETVDYNPDIYFYDGSNVNRVGFNSNYMGNIDNPIYRTVHGEDDFVIGNGGIIYSLRRIGDFDSSLFNQTYNGNMLVDCNDWTGDGIGLCGKTYANTIAADNLELYGNYDDDNSRYYETSIIMNYNQICSSGENFYKGNTIINYIPSVSGTLAVDNTITDGWNSTKTYSTGDYCIYRGALYKYTASATSVKTSAPTTSGSGWEQVTIMSEIQSLQSEIDDLSSRLSALEEASTSE